MDEGTTTRTFARGNSGQRVCIIQEWLCLHGLHVNIDGKYGPATESAVRDFQLHSRLVANGEVTPATYLSLVEPMRVAVRPIEANGRGLHELVVLHAYQFLAVHPREIGGQNRGPWVRLFMDGFEGQNRPWCAGFVSYLILAACRDSDQPLPLRLSQ